MKPQIEKITVRTETLDGSLPAGYVPALIKIDVIGAAHLVIEGAIETISKYKPIVTFEHSNLSAVNYGHQTSHIYELLHDEAGLRIFELDGTGPFSLSEFEETVAYSNRWSFMARP